MMGNDPRETADRLAIMDLIYRYCRAVDRIDRELGYSVWHDDAEADYGEALYRGAGRGFIDQVCAAHRQLLSHSHQVTNIILDVDGDRAASESYVMATLRMQNDGKVQHCLVWGRYIDQWERRGGRWGIVKRVYAHDFDELRDAGPMVNPVNATRDRNDPSYAALR